MSVLLLFSVAFLVVWVLLADWYFDSSPEGFRPRYEHGVSSLVEQLGASFYTPAYLVQSAVERFRSGNAPIHRGPLFIAAILQLWPIFLLSVRRWPSLTRTTKRVVLAYSLIVGVLAVVGFGYLRYSWAASFGP